MDWLFMCGWAASVLLLILLRRAYRRRTLHVAKSAPKSERYFPGQVGALCPFAEEEREKVADVVAFVREQQRQFRFEGNMDVHRRREDAYEQTASTAAEFFRRGLLRADELRRERSDKVFLCHRWLGLHDADSGLLIRLTVNSNLFGGSVANMGTEEQVKWLQGVYDRGELGCFMLTEEGAGVLSGLIVACTATWTPQGYVLRSPPPVDRSRKKWISQGQVARWGVVIADLCVPAGGEGVESKGPHAFVVDMKLAGVRVEDMPRKTAFNSLDNSLVEFDDALLPHSALLAGASYVAEDGTYVLRDEKAPFNFIRVAQRLLAGRICLSGFSLGKLYMVLNECETYCAQRMVPVMGCDQLRPLAQLPCIADAFALYRAQWCVYARYIELLEDEYRRNRDLTAAQVHEIACAKTEINEYCTTVLKKLKARVGAYALMEDGAFNYETEVFMLVRFAEGDVGILQQKMARDAMKRVSSPLGLLRTALSVPLAWLADDKGAGAVEAELRWNLCTLARKLMFKDKRRVVDAWLHHHRTVHHISKLYGLLTIYHKVFPSLKGTWSLEIFRRYMENVKLGLA